MRHDDHRARGPGGSAHRAGLLGILLLLLAGCGAERYEERLANTRAYFAHQDLLKQNLQDAWGDPETGVSLRVPMQFTLMPPPAKPAAAGGNAGAEEMADAEEEELIDDRQPAYMNVELPGLHGAFRAPMKFTGDGNALREGDGFLYVLTNHHLAEQPDLARDFKKLVVQNLSEALHLTVEPGDWKDDRFPLEARAKATFVKSLPYKTVTLTSTEDIAGYIREFSAYMYDQGTIQVVVLFVLPKDVDSGEKLLERIPLCLETLVVSGQSLSVSAPAGGGGSTVAPGGF